MTRGWSRRKGSNHEIHPFSTRRDQPDDSNFRTLETFMIVIAISCDMSHYLGYK
jgi:hypothetical protein